MWLEKFFRYIFWGGVLGKLAFSGMGLPGRRRVSLTKGYFDVEDLEKEFKKHTLSKKARRKFKEAVIAYQNRDFEKARRLYFEMDNFPNNGKTIIFSEQSAVVAYNVYLVYHFSGQIATSQIYLERYQKLQLEAEEN
ncbi:MAG: hypothetical protein JXA21_23235 [Anaerolineae bacterium]|nr:hypothetical protein [Anaerolineae bacterium]